MTGVDEHIAAPVLVYHEAIGYLADKRNLCFQRELSHHLF